MKITFIINSLYYPREKFHEKIGNDLIIDPNHEVEFLFTTAKGDASNLAGNAVQSGSNLIIACGGDGTLHEVVNGFMKSETEGQTPVIGHFPIGTGNDFSRNFNFTNDTKDLVTRLSQINHNSIDIGKMNLSDGNVIHFHNEISFGFGAEVIRQMENNSSGKGKSYLRTIISAFRKHKATKVKITGDDFTWEGNAFIIVIANGKYMGGGLSLAPEAIPHDGIFNITIVGEVSFWDFLTRLPSIMRARPLRHPQIHYFESRMVEIIAEDGSYAAESDGEVISSFPSRISCLPARMRFLA